MRVLKTWPVLLAMLIVSPATFCAGHETRDELDAFWSEIARSVTVGDFEAYAASYHEDAIMVSGFSMSSNSISQSLDGWEQGFIDTLAGKNKVSLEFRFTQRFNDATTAHETGIFYYSSTDENGERSDSHVHFEALLVRKNGWKMMMEYQVSSATTGEWEAAKPE